jgi:acyl-CoA synthetase (AMP-forming)/AMP-acid ligase II
MRTDTVGELLERVSERSKVGLRFLDRAERATFFPWSEVWRRALKTSGRLHRAGIEPGDRVALIFPTSIDFIDAFFGTVLSGAVPVPFYPPVRLHRLEDYGARTARMLEAVSAKLVLADGRIRPILGSAVAAAEPPLGCRLLSELTPGSDAAVSRSDEELALIQFSSGTTMDPKPAALSHRAVVAQAVALNGHWPDTDDCTHSGVSWLPLYHDMGLIGCVMTALERRAFMTLIPPELFLARPAMWLRAISTYGATISVAPNFAYGLCVAKIRDEQLESVDLSSWRVALCGAEPVVPRVLRRFIDRFEPYGLRAEALTPVYGLSEATLAVTFSDLDRPFVSRRFDHDLLSGEDRAEETREGLELVSVGRPLDGVDVRVVNSDRSDQPPGLVGSVLVRGPSVMEGYFGRADATREVIEDGWLDTGDLGFFHRGELFLTGRKKDVLILRGRNHSPTEVEAAADEVEGVRTGCSVAVSWLPDGTDGEVLLLLVEVGRDAGGSDAGAIARDCRTAVRAATGLELDHVETLEPGTLPRTSSGKLRRAESLSLYLAGELLPPERMTPWRLAGAAVKGSMELARLNRIIRRG